MLKRNVVICIASIILCLGGIILADEIVNINPHKIVLNAVGAFDDVQANVRIVLPGASIVNFEATLTLDGIDVAEAESAYYCVDDDILIVGFDRTELQTAIPDDMANKTVTATVKGFVTVKISENEEITREFSGSDSVEIVAPGKKG